MKKRGEKSPLVIFNTLIINGLYLMDILKPLCIDYQAVTKFQNYS